MPASLGTATAAVSAFLGAFLVLVFFALAAFTLGLATAFGLTVFFAATFAGAAGFVCTIGKVRIFAASRVGVVVHCQLPEICAQALPSLASS